jgi:hypothetical protein
VFWYVWLDCVLLFFCFFADTWTFLIQQYLWHCLVWSNYWPSFKFSIDSFDIHFFLCSRSVKLGLRVATALDDTFVFLFWWSLFFSYRSQLGFYFMQSETVAFLNTIVRDPE